ncbi:MAG: hypothetical protein HC896_00465 [Bacteroidales bacterium]|nr:hypothetical protein [Bacteroidales bacterium]
MYVCATSSVPIAAVLMLKGLSPGAALVFLMAGPATNVATITVIGKTMGRKTLFVYLASIIVGALAFGLMIDTFLPPSWFILPMSSSHSHQHQLLPHWLQLTSSGILGLLLAYSLVKRYLPKKVMQTIGSKTAPGFKLYTPNSTKISVKGMNCNHCRTNVTNALHTIEGIKIIEVSLSDESVTIDGSDLDLGSIKEKVEGLGYKFGGIV